MVFWITTTADCGTMLILWGRKRDWGKASESRVDFFVAQICFGCGLDEPHHFLRFRFWDMSIWFGNRSEHSSLEISLLWMPVASIVDGNLWEFKVFVAESLMLRDFVARNAASSIGHGGMFVFSFWNFSLVFCPYISYTSTGSPTVPPKIPWRCGSSAAFKGGLWPMWLQFIPFEEIIRYRKFPGCGFGKLGPNVWKTYVKKMLKIENLIWNLTPKKTWLKAVHPQIPNCSSCQVASPRLAHMSYVSPNDPFNLDGLIILIHMNLLDEIVLFLIPILEYFGTHGPGSLIWCRNPRVFGRGEPPDFRGSRCWIH